MILKSAPVAPPAPRCPGFGADAGHCDRPAGSGFTTPVLCPRCDDLKRQAIREGKVRRA